MTTPMESARLLIMGYRQEAHPWHQDHLARMALESLDAGRLDPVRRWEAAERGRVAASPIDDMTCWPHRALAALGAVREYLAALQWVRDLGRRGDDVGLMARAVLADLEAVPTFFDALEEAGLGHARAPLLPLAGPQPAEMPQAKPYRRGECVVRLPGRNDDILDGTLSVVVCLLGGCLRDCVWRIRSRHARGDAAVVRRILVRVLRNAKHPPDWEWVDIACARLGLDAGDVRARAAVARPAPAGVVSSAPVARGEDEDNG